MVSVSQTIHTGPCLPIPHSPHPSTPPPKKKNGEGGNPATSLLVLSGSEEVQEVAC